MSHTDDSISVVIQPPNSKPMSQAREGQLANARKMAVVSRRHKQKQRLEAKLAELRALMGQDMSIDQLTRIASRLLEQEERLREKQNALTETCNSNLDCITLELSKLRRLMERIVDGNTRAPTSQPHDRHYASSSVGSVASLHAATHSSRPRSPRGQR